MTRLEFITDAIKNPGKVYTSAKGHLLWRVTMFGNALAFEFQEGIDDWKMTYYIEDYQYQIHQSVEQPEPDFAEKYIELRMNPYHPLKRENYGAEADLILALVDGKVMELREQITKELATKVTRSIKDY